MWADLKVDAGQRDGVTVISVEGELDCYSAPRLREAVIAATSWPGCRVVIDLAACDFIDSTGLGVLVGAFKRSREQGGGAALAGLQSRVLATLKMTGLVKVLTICGTADEAVAALRLEG